MQPSKEQIEAAAQREGKRMSTIERLAELAKGATQGVWTWINANSSQSRLGRLFAEHSLVLDADPGIFGNVADGAFIAHCNPAAIAQAAAEYAALERRNAELVAKVLLLADVLEAALSSVESMQKFELCREIEDALESVQALGHTQEKADAAE